jgi:pimeloyl-ACP methyl ester carboxylesterase
MTPIRYRAGDVDSFKVFYREAGSAGAPKLLLLHGFPSAGHMRWNGPRFFGLRDNRSAAVVP